MLNLHRDKKKIERRELGRDWKILSDHHGQDGNAALRGIGNLAR